MLAREGVTDLSTLRVEPITYDFWGPDPNCYTGGDEGAPCPYITTRVPGYRFRSGNLAFGFVGDPQTREPNPALYDSEAGYQVAFSAAGHGHVSYYVVPRANGFAIVPVWGSSSEAAEYRNALKMLATVVVGFALPATGVSVANGLGSTIVGSQIAATYPALSSLVGNVALSTAFNGGDIVAAVKGAAVNFLSGGVGSRVVDMTQVDILGKLAAIVTSAAISGRDVQGAVVNALASFGVSQLGSLFVMDDFDFDLEDVAIFDDPGTWEDFGPYGGPVQMFPETDQGPILTYDYGNGFDDGLTDDDLIAFDEIDYGDTTIPSFPVSTAPGSDVYGGYPDTDLYPFGPPVVEMMPIPTVDYSDPSGTGNTGGISISSLMVGALQLVKSWQTVQAAIKGNPQSTTATGGTKTTMSNGTIVTREPNGKTTTTLPPVGVPMATVDGGLIVNNGNGTYEYIGANGTRQTRQYSSGSSGGAVSAGSSGMIFGMPKNTAYMIGAAALVGVLMLSRRRGS